MDLENICYIVGAASLDGVRLSPRPGDYVIAADGGYRTLKARGIEPDFVMGDFDSLGYRPDHPNVETHPVMKDDTDLGLAVRWALAHGYRRLVMAGALGGRLDQTIASFQTLRGLTDAGAQGWLIGCGWVVTAVQNGTLAFPAGMEGTVSVFSSGDAARGVTLRGLLYEITDAELRLRHAARREQFVHRRGGHGARHRRHGLCPLAGQRAAGRAGGAPWSGLTCTRTRSRPTARTRRPTVVQQGGGSSACGPWPITDHDSVSPACRRPSRRGRRCGIEVVPGVELSTVWGGEEVHLLGYLHGHGQCRAARAHDPRDRRAQCPQRDHGAAPARRGLPHHDGRTCTRPSRGRRCSAGRTSRRCSCSAGASPRCPTGCAACSAGARRFTSRAITSRWRIPSAPCARRAACRSWRIIFKYRFDDAQRARHARRGGGCRGARRSRCATRPIRPSRRRPRRRWPRASASRPPAARTTTACASRTSPSARGAAGCACRMPISPGVKALAGRGCV